jgi:small subunit ribosomal protein S14
MAKVSSFTKNKRRERLSDAAREKRAVLKATIMNKNTTMEERMEAVVRLAQLPRNSARVRVRNRCEITGRPRAFYRKFRMSRISLRQLGSQGLIPGLVKSSW